MARAQPIVRVCVPAAVLARLQDMAAREALSLSAVSRRALMRGLGLRPAGDQEDTKPEDRAL